MSPMTGSSAAAFGSGWTDDVVDVPAYLMEIFPLDRPSGVLAVRFWFGSFGFSLTPPLSQIVCWLETVVCWSWLPEMCACTHCHAWLLTACQVSGLFFARGCPTSASATSTGQSGFSCFRYLNWRKD